MNKIILAGIVTLATAILTACGGGDTASSSNSSDPTSYWKMDAYEYINGGNSAVTTSSITGVPVTTAAISTATLSGGDSSNGIYSGSALTFTFKGTPVTGVYSVVSSRTAFVAADVSTAPIFVEATVGIARTTGSSQYAASSGQVQVTRDTSGTYHFTSVAAMPTTKTLDVLGGVAGAPSTMALSIVDAY